MEGISKFPYFHKLYLMLEQLGDPLHPSKCSYSKENS